MHTHTDQTELFLDAKSFRVGTMEGRWCGVACSLHKAFQVFSTTRDVGSHVAPGNLEKQYLCMTCYVPAVSESGHDHLANLVVDVTRP